MARISLDNPQYFLNRDTSWLAFNRRVLEEAEDTGNPLLERLKFLSISASNLDEFFEVRVAAMMQQIEDGYNEAGPDGLTLTEKRDVLNKLTHEFVDDQYDCWNARLRPALSENGIRVLGLHELDSEQLRFVDEYCEKELDPLLTPVTVDPAHPFPRVINKALCLGFLLRRRRRSALTYTGVVSVPRALPRLVRLPSEGTDDFIFLADLVAHHAVRMYHGYDVVSSAPFRVTRNSNLYLAEEEARSLLESVRAELHNRRKGDAVRMEIEADADPEIIDRLRTVFELDPWQVFPVNGPVNLSRLFNVYEQVKRPDLKYRSFSPRELRLTAKSKDLFEELRSHDILLHHPYDSYDAVVSFVESAAEDDNVLSIKQTLYRTSEHSAIVPSLIDAASRKEVTAVVELKARFDEASNIRWARDLEDAGVQVFHGLVGLKTHCKLSLLVRRDPDGATRSYAHIGTGNYNATTARIYTDLSLFTANPEITRAVHDVFSFLTAYAENPSYEPLLVAPLDLADKCHRADRPRSRACPPGQGSSHHRQNERLARQDGRAGAVSRFSGGSANRFDCSRHLRAASRVCAASATISACAASWDDSSSTAASTTLPTAARKKSTWAAPTGCRAICTSASKCWSRCATRCCATGCGMKFWMPTSPTIARRACCSRTRLTSARGSRYTANAIAIRRPARRRLARRIS